MTKSPLISNQTGQPIDNDANLRQSIIDVLITPIGSRLMRRDYGCGISELIDAPANNNLIALMKAHIAKALKRWILNFAAKKILIEKNQTQFLITIIGLRTDTPNNSTLTIQFGV